MVCLCYTDRKNERKIVKCGAKDSKLLSQESRDNIYKQLKDFCSFKYYIISAIDINQRMGEGITLNDIEAEAIAGLIKGTSELNGADIFIDLIDRYLWVFSKRMEKYGIHRYEAQHHADIIFPIVSAASICAKCIREEEIRKIKQNIGIDFGSGYPSDPKTRSALRNIPVELKAYIRTRWKTLETVKQRRLSEF